MKKIFIAIISILLVCLGLAGLAHHLEKPAAGGKGQSLIIYNWGDYLDPKLIKNLRSNLVIMWFMKHLILTKRCTLRLNKVVPHTI